VYHGKHSHWHHKYYCERNSCYFYWCPSASSYYWWCADHGCYYPYGYVPAGLGLSFSW
jgi:hypothetical protein